MIHKTFRQKILWSKVVGGRAIFNITHAFLCFFSGLNTTLTLFLFSSQWDVVVGPKDKYCFCKKSLMVLGSSYNVVWTSKDLKKFYESIMIFGFSKSKGKRDYFELKSCANILPLLMLPFFIVICQNGEKCGIYQKKCLLMLSKYARLRNLIC